MFIKFLYRLCFALGALLKYRYISMFYEKCAKLLKKGFDNYGDISYKLHRNYMN